MTSLAARIGGIENPVGTSRTLLGAGIAAVAALAVLSLTSAGPTALFWDNLQQLAAGTIAVAVLVVASRRGAGEQRRVAVGILHALLLALAGLLVWDLQPEGSAVTSVAANLLLVAAAVLGLSVLIPSVVRGLDRARIGIVIADAVIGFLASAAVAAWIWRNAMGISPGTNEALALIGAVALFAGAAACVATLLARRIPVGLYGPWSVTAGLFLVGVSWIVWLDMSVTGTATNVMPSDFGFSAGALLLGYGGATWSIPVADAGQLWLVRAVGDALPIVAMFGTVGFAILSEGGMDLEDALILGILFAAVIRQALMNGSERRARHAELDTGRRLHREQEERSETLAALSRLDAVGTPEEIARQICERALGLSGIDTAVLRAFCPTGVIPLALAGMQPPQGTVTGEPLPEDRAAFIVGRMAAGVWIERMEPGVSDYVDALHAAGLRGVVNAPLRWNDRVIGAIGLGTHSEEAAAALDERISTVREFGVVAGALIGPALEEREQAERVRGEIRAVIEAEAFRPVFQPIVDISSGAAVGYEALTRFADGTRPDLRFAEAASAGLDTELEMACLRAAVRETHQLPVGTFVSLNVSPALAFRLLPLLSIVADSPRDVVVEITEHVPIDDYARLTAALATLRGDVRISIDDAGAGYAGLRHILEMRPHFVKLDIALVRNVDGDPARRAMIRSMTSFAAETGCTLIAEGIERREELETLRSLGVPLGQGYFLARPAPAAELVH